VTEPPAERFGPRELFETALELSLTFRNGLDERAPVSPATVGALRSRLAPLPEAGVSPTKALAELWEAVEPGLAATGGPRFFFGSGGSLPVAVASDWLTSAWDQNAGLVVLSPAAAAFEQHVAGWLRDLLDLPGECSVGFVTGGQAANLTALAAARHALLARTGHDVERDGLWHAPRLAVLASAESHATIFAALRMLGLGDGIYRPIDVDDQGRIRPDALRELLAAHTGPTLICSQAGNVATGACDPFDEIAEAARIHGNCWIHVDGAFGLWARATTTHRHLTTGVEQADSWTLDPHKWLNVPYDNAVVLVRDRTAHRAAMTLRAPYLNHGSPPDLENPTDFVPEASRRARGFVLYATMRSLGRRGIAEIVERSCRQAQLIHRALAERPDIEVLNDVVLNQVLVRFPGRSAELSDQRTDAVIKRVQDEAVCWVGGTIWQERRAMRIALVNWSTGDRDIERAIDSIRSAATTVLDS
jgi:glutamate/tyrosine decarboxylase-like PLP-dependent enzyme